MKKHFYFAALFLTSAFTACTQDEDIAVQRVNNESPVGTRTSVVNREDVSISDISQISANFWAKQAGEGVMTKSSAPKSIREIQPILNEAGTDTMAFAVNYANNGGYILVSATRDYYPILAYSDEGQFETDKSYNSNLPLVDGQHPWAGCVTVAVAQIMKYHKYPANYNWNAMNNKETSSTNWSYTANLIKDVADAVDADLGVTESPASIGNARDALVNEFGYSSDAKIIDHLFGDTHYSLNTYGVVLMTGIRIDEEGERNGHAWVCDGYKTDYYKTEYLLMVIPSETGYFYEQEGSYIKNGSNCSYSHINWGWDGSSDNWYLDDNLVVGDRNYKYDRKDIINIHPR